jgi:hypothetical protein
MAGSEYNEVLNAIKALWDSTQSETIYLSPNDGHLRSVPTPQIRSILKGLQNKGYITLLKAPLIDPVNRHPSNNAIYLCYEIHLQKSLIEIFTPSVVDQAVTLSTQEEKPNDAKILWLDYTQKY